MATAGRAAYLKDASAFVDQVMAISGQYFRQLPKAKLEVRAVEKWREATAPIAFYNQPAPDGSRPGIYYVNLSDMRQVLKPQIEGISYHEGAPGHHFQIALAQELAGVPKFRRFGNYGAYAEGWGLYAEKLGKEAGFYQDPISDFGRLSTELWRAVRLVLDTGLHSKKWTREQAMVRHSSRSMPASANSSVSFGQGPEVRFITSFIASPTMLTQNTPEERMLATLSLVSPRSGLAPVEEKITCGGV